MMIVLRMPVREYLESSCDDVTRYTQTVWYLAVCKLQSCELAQHLSSEP